MTKEIATFVYFSNICYHTKCQCWMVTCQCFSHFRRFCSCWFGIMVVVYEQVWT